MKTKVAKDYLRRLRQRYKKADVLCPSFALEKSRSLPRVKVMLAKWNDFYSPNWLETIYYPEVAMRQTQAL